MIIRVIEKWLNLSRWHEDFRESSFVFIALSFLTAIFSFFLYYNIFIVPFPPMILLDGLGVLGCLVGFYFLKGNRRSRLAGIIAVVVMMVISLLYIADTGNEEFALAFTLSIPVISIFVVGYRLGATFSVLNFAVIAWLCFSQMPNWTAVPFDNISFIHLTVIYFTLFAIAYFYDSGRRQTMALLKESNAKLQQISVTDALTQLPNRLYIEEFLINSNQVHWIVILDIDDFKKINDRYGHDVGDKVLQIVAQKIESCVGGNGVACRWGGEEFLMAFYLQEIEVIQDKILRLQQEIAAFEFGLRDPITFSCGGAPHQPKHYRKAFRQADEALYRAKKAGKNSFVYDVIARVS
ncbi:GGDEF domain-containing protein [Vibrio vulnificus]